MDSTVDWTWMFRRLGIALASILLASSGAFAGTKVAAISRPSGDKTMAFVRPGQIAEFLVKEGDTVKPGQNLVRLNDEAEQIITQRLKAEAEDKIRIQASKAKLDQKRVDLKRIEQAKVKGVATDLEVENARLDVIISELEYKLQMFNGTQDHRKYLEAKVELEKMNLKCPTDTSDTPETTYRVETVFKQTGESVDRLDEVVRIVRVDPLWIDAPVALADVRGLKLRVGQEAWVVFPGQQDKAKAKITFIAAVADAASGTRAVRVEVSNSANRPAGEYVTVEFDAWKEPVAATTQPAQSIKAK